MNTYQAHYVSSSKTTVGLALSLKKSWIFIETRLTSQIGVYCSKCCLVFDVDTNDRLLNVV